VLMFHKGHQAKKRRCYVDPWCDTHLWSWVKMLLQPLDRAPMWCVLLILWLNLFCTTLFLGFSKATCWIDVSLWASLLNTNNFACFLLHHLNQPIWNEMISKQTLTFGIHFAITSRIGERSICQLGLTTYT